MVEILSPKTRRIDRREKFLTDTTMPSLRRYLLISQEFRTVGVFRPEHGWKAEAFCEGAVLLGCLHGALPLEAIYEGVDLA